MRAPRTVSARPAEERKSSEQDCCDRDCAHECLLTRKQPRPSVAHSHLSVPEKTNEITAIPDLLDELAETGKLEGALVTTDAMGCQVAIADKIVAHRADYLLPLYD